MDQRYPLPSVGFLAVAAVLYSMHVGYAEQGASYGYAETGPTYGHAGHGVLSYGYTEDGSSHRNSYGHPEHDPQYGHAGRGPSHAHAEDNKIFGHVVHDQDLNFTTLMNNMGNIFNKPFRITSRLQAENYSEGFNNIRTYDKTSRFAENYLYNSTLTENSNMNNFLNPIKNFHNFNATALINNNHRSLSQQRTKSPRNRRNTVKNKGELGKLLYENQEPIDTTHQLPLQKEVKVSKINFSDTSIDLKVQHATYRGDMGTVNRNNEKSNKNRLKFIVDDFNDLFKHMGLSMHCPFESRIIMQGLIMDTIDGVRNAEHSLMTKFLSTQKSVQALQSELDNCPQNEGEFPRLDVQNFIDDIDEDLTELLSVKLQPIKQILGALDLSRLMEYAQIAKFMCPLVLNVHPTEEQSCNYELEKTVNTITSLIPDNSLKIRKRRFLEDFSSLNPLTDAADRAGYYHDTEIVLIQGENYDKNAKFMYPLKMLFAFCTYGLIGILSYVIYLMPIEGVKGEKGMKGWKGYKGHWGHTGEHGDKGEMGETGAQGVAGQKGWKGWKGFKGIKGEKGDKGPKGEQGVMGVEGEKGHKGKQGHPGNVGDIGVKGFKGMEGLKGFSGFFTHLKKNKKKKHHGHHRNYQGYHEHDFRDHDFRKHGKDYVDRLGGHDYVGLDDLEYSDHHGGHGHHHGHHGSLAYLHHDEHHKGQYYEFGKPVGHRLHPIYDYEDREFYVENHDKGSKGEEKLIIKNILHKHKHSHKFKHSFEHEREYDPFMFPVTLKPPWPPPPGKRKKRNVDNIAGWSYVPTFSLLLGQYKRPMTLESDSFAAADDFAALKHKIQLRVNRAMKQRPDEDTIEDAQNNGGEILTDSLKRGTYYRPHNNSPNESLPLSFKQPKILISTIGGEKVNAKREIETVSPIKIVQIGADDNDSSYSKPRKSLHATSTMKMLRNGEYAPMPSIEEHRIPIHGREASYEEEKEKIGAIVGKARRRRRFGKEEGQTLLPPDDMNALGNSGNENNSKNIELIEAINRIWREHKQPTGCSQCFLFQFLLDQPTISLDSYIM